jgi:hypothetical protein
MTGLTVVLSDTRIAEIDAILTAVMSSDLNGSTQPSKLSDSLGISGGGK